MIREEVEYMLLKKTKYFMLCSLAMGLLTACGNAAVMDKSSSTEESKVVVSTEADDEMELKVEDIDWCVEESILDGNKFLSLNYTNNSQYTIMDVEITFKQKEGLTPEQLSAFDKYKETYELTDEEVAEIYILGYNRKCAKPGETVKDSPLVLNGTYYFAESMEQYELMEPETITVVFIGSDEKGYVMYYDYKSQVYGSSTHDAVDIHQWSDKDLAKLIGIPDCPAINVDEDEDDSFGFTAYGVKKDLYKAYVADVKERGFTKEADEDETSYEAVNADGVTIDITFSFVEESMDVELEKE